jgi:putative ATPase
MRGSDPDAAVYWLAKMLHAGEDIRFIARRIVIFASEDIGNADPRALSVAVNAMQAIEMIGMPEARIILSQAVTYCSTAPKSNAAYAAVNAALSDIKNERVSPVPRHLRDASYKGAKEQGNGQGYQYPHDFEGNFAVQDYLGIDKTYYSPKGNGYELKIKERIDYWNECRQKNVSERVEK